MSTANRANLALGTLNIYILIFLLGRINKEDKWLNWWVGIILGIIATWYTVTKAVSLPPVEGYLGPVKIVIASILFGVMFILIFNMNKQKCQTAFMYLAILTAFASGLCVNPIIRTTDIIYEKPIAKKIAEIREENPNAIWISDAASFHVSNYMVANGVRTLNSTSVYPSLEFYEKL